VTSVLSITTMWVVKKSKGKTRSDFAIIKPLRESRQLLRPVTPLAAAR
jgi:hypothetical protein